MNRTQWIATAVSGVVVVGLTAFAAPAVVGSIDEVATRRMPFTEEITAAGPTPEPIGAPTTPTPTPRTITDRTHGDCELLYYPRSAGSPKLPAPIDNGPREFATGEVYTEDGIPTTYTVAPGDAMQAIGARFCTFATDVFYMNERHLLGVIQPGDVLRLRP